MPRHAVILIGPPGVGKGTQAVAIIRNFKLIHIATGEILRREVAQLSDLGKKAKAFMDRGELVPNNLVIEMVANTLNSSPKESGFLLDGFPRSLEQAQAMESMLKQLDITISKVISIDAPENTLIDRIAIRADTEVPRADDKQEIFRQRLKVYERETKPLFDYYRKKQLLSVINGNQPREQVFKAIEAVLKK